MCVCVCVCVCVCHHDVSAGAACACMHCVCGCLRARMCACGHIYLRKTRPAAGYTHTHTRSQLCIHAHARTNGDGYAGARRHEHEGRVARPGDLLGQRPAAGHLHVSRWVGVSNQDKACVKPCSTLVTLVIWLQKPCGDLVAKTTCTHTHAYLFLAYTHTTNQPTHLDRHRLLLPREEGLTQGLVCMCVCVCVGMRYAPAWVHVCAGAHVCTLHSMG